MRLGMNPQKEEKQLEIDTYHRIIVVVYIPEDDSGFYKNSFEVFNACIISLISSVNKYAKITVVNNGSNAVVTDYLNSCYLNKTIDSIINHNTNIGKIDALVGAARGAREPLITLADADILFKNGWQEQVETIFANFENVGSVSPISVRNSELYCTSYTLKQILLKRLNFTYKSVPENLPDYNKYMKSINWDIETNPDLKWPVIEANNIKALVGSGHQILTIDRDILFETVPKDPSYILVGNQSEYKYIDEPIDKSGRLRLSTYNNFAYHMGNKLEKWMLEIVKENKKNINVDQIIFKKTRPRKSIKFKVKRKIFTGKRLLYKKIFLNLYSR